MGYNKPPQPLEQAPAASKEMNLVRNDVPLSPIEAFDTDEPEPYQNQREQVDEDFPF